MSFQITEAFVQEFSDNVMMLSQQKGTRLRPFVRQESIKGKSKAFDRIGKVEAQDKVGRHSNTVQVDTPHSRRWCFLADKVWADLIDQQDKIRVLNDPTSEYVMAAYWAFGRKMDEVILNAADATIITGEDADGSVAFPNSQRYAANDGTNFTDLNVDTLRYIKKIFDANEVDPYEQRHIAVTSNQIYSLLADDRITSQDYNTVRALAEGKVDTYMGFKFHQLEGIKKQVTALTAQPATGIVGTGNTIVGTRKCVAWTKPGLILGVGEDVTSRITERDDKDYATQPYMRMTIGSTRMEEEQVVIVHCTES